MYNQEYYNDESKWICQSNLYEVLKIMRTIYLDYFFDLSWAGVHQFTRKNTMFINIIEKKVK